MDNVTPNRLNELLEKTPDNVDKTARDFDNILCTNCGYDGLVNLGDETCPKCGEEGDLQWKEGEPQEVSR